MGRKKKLKEAEPTKCSHCKTIVVKNDPVNGLIYEWNGKLSAICRDCGAMVVALFQIMDQRWG